MGTERWQNQDAWNSGVSSALARQDQPPLLAPAPALALLSEGAWCTPTALVSRARGGPTQGRSPRPPPALALVLALALALLGASPVLRGELLSLAPEGVVHFHA